MSTLSVQIHRRQFTPTTQFNHTQSSRVPLFSLASHALPTFSPFSSLPLFPNLPQQPTVDTPSQRKESTHNNKHTRRPNMGSRTRATAHGWVSHGDWVKSGECDGVVGSARTGSSPWNATRGAGNWVSHRRRSTYSTTRGTTNEGMWWVRDPCQCLRQARAEEGCRRTSSMARTDRG